MFASSPRLLVVAHGTRSETGSATTAALVAAIAAARPDVPVELCFLDVSRPTLADALAADSSRAVVVPLLLSTGYHVQHDIPAAAAAYPDVVVARHLGPHPLLTSALVDRLAEVRTTEPASTLLVAAGSSRPEAHDELRAAGELLAEQLGRAVAVATLADDLVSRISDIEPPVEIATYLLAEGQFAETLGTAAGSATVAAPIGVHPALIELVWRRYDEALDGD